MKVISVPNNTKKLMKFITGISLVIFLTVTALSNQIRGTIAPFFKSYKLMPQLLVKDDLSLLKGASYQVYRIIDEINKYPEDTNFYFSPCFEDSGNTYIWWWYLHILIRYFCYPRKILCMDPLLYSGNKHEFKSKYIGDAKHYSDLEWIRSRNVKYIILFRNNTLSILPIGTEIIL